MMSSGPMRCVRIHESHFVVGLSVQAAKLMPFAERLLAWIPDHPPCYPTASFRPAWRQHGDVISFVYSMAVARYGRCFALAASDPYDVHLHRSHWPQHCFQTLHWLTKLRHPPFSKVASGLRDLRFRRSIRVRSGQSTIDLLRRLFEKVTGTEQYRALTARSRRIARAVDAKR